MRLPALQNSKVTMSLSIEEQKIEEARKQRRSQLQEMIEAQYDYQQSARHMLSDEEQSSNPKFVLGQPPLDADAIAVIGVSFSSLEDKGIHIGAYGLTWWGDKYPAQANSYVDPVGGDLLAFFEALRAALRACKPHESITIITQTPQIIQFVNEGKLRGKKKGVHQQIVSELLEEIRSRSGRVQGLELKDGWVVSLHKYVTKLAQVARKLRILEDPNLSREQQMELDSMASTKPVHTVQPPLAKQSVSPPSIPQTSAHEELTFSFDPFASVRQISIASLQAQNDQAFYPLIRKRSSTSTSETQDYIPLSDTPISSQQYPAAMSTQSSIAPSAPCQTSTLFSPTFGDMRPIAVPEGGENDSVLARPPLAVQSADVSTDMSLSRHNTTGGEEIMMPDSTTKNVHKSITSWSQASLKRPHTDKDGDFSDSKRQKGAQISATEEYDPNAWKEWASKLFPP